MSERVRSRIEVHPDPPPSCPRCQHAAVPILYIKESKWTATEKASVADSVEFVSANAVHDSPGWLCRTCGERFGPRNAAISFAGAATASRIADNGHRLSALYGQYVPRGRQAYANSDAMMLACLARAHYTMVTILAFAHRQIDCLALLRSMYEHVVTFAWVAIDPEQNYHAFCRWEQKERLKMSADQAEHSSFGVDRSAVVRPLADAGPACGPEMPERALQADAYWNRIESNWEFHFRSAYATLSRTSSAYVHPTLMGLEPFVSRNERGTRIGLPMLLSGRNVASEAALLFADALAVASWRLRWPPRHEIAQALTYGIDVPEV